MIVPIHNHSEYSALDGLSSCQEIADRCVEIGCPCCGLSDHGVVTGHLEFDKVMRAAGIKPIFACELYHGVKIEFAKNERDQAHFLAGAITDEGLRNLWRLVDASAYNFRYVGRVNWEMLKKYNEGLFATSACISGLVPQGVLRDDLDPLNRYLEIFKDRFYLEIHAYPGEEHELLNKKLVQIGQERGIGLTYATDAHFARRDQYETHDVYLMTRGEDKNTPPEERKMWHPPALWIKDEDEIRESLAYLPESAVDEAIANSVAIGEMCNASLPKVKDHLPVFIPSESPWIKGEDKKKTAAEFLLDEVERGVKERYGENAGKEVWDRAAHELEILLGADLEHYFLIAWDQIQFLIHEDIEKSVRGSVGGSIVAYALRITDIDPLYYGLFFERFYNAGRADGLPDIDIDISSKKRSRAIDYLKDRWGDKNVRQIGNTAHMKPKAALDQFYAKFGVTWDEKEEVKKMMLAALPEIDILDSKAVGWSQEVDPGKYIYVIDGRKNSEGKWERGIGDSLKEWVGKQPAKRQEVLQNWLDFVAIVCNRVANYGTHASGVVVSADPLDDELPGRWIADAKIVVTQFPMADVEKRQFMKLDNLGVIALDVLQDWRDMMAKDGIEIDWEQIIQLSQNLDELPDELYPMYDEAWENLRKYPLGIFQIERGYPAKLCKNIAPRSISDLSVIVAINRPGPINSKAPESYIARKNGDEPVTYDDPILEDVLDETYGWFLYQEQVITYFRKLGYTLSEADAVRKILGKKRPEQLHGLYYGEDEWEGRAYPDMARKAGVDDKAAKVIWDKLEWFAEYSFNKAHSVAYGVVGFKTTFAKTNGPLKYILSSVENRPKKASAWVVESRRRGYKILPPDILRSTVSMDIIDGDILYGLSNVKGVGVQAAKYILQLRDKYDISDPLKLSEALSIEKESWEKRRDDTKAVNSKFYEKSPNTILKSDQITALACSGAFDPYIEDDTPLREKQKYEKEYLDVILTDTAYEALERNDVELVECDTYDTLEYADIGQVVKLPGIISGIRETQTRKAPHKPMLIVTIEYEDDIAEFIVFDQQIKANKRLWRERVPGVFDLKKTERGVSFQSGIKLT